MQNRLVVAKFVVRVLLTFSIFIVGVVLAFTASDESMQFWGLTLINGSWTAWLSPGKAKLKQALKRAGSQYDGAAAVVSTRLDAELTDDAEMYYRSPTAESSDDEAISDAVLDAMERGTKKRKTKRKSVRH